MAEALPDGRVITCRPTVERAEDPDVLAARFRAAGYDEVEAGGAVESAVEDALAGAGPDDCVLVAGSLYAVAAARRRWSRVVIPTRVETVDEGRAAMDRANVPATAPGGVVPPAADSVHRVLRTRLQRPLAHRLAEELRSLGGRCAISGVRDHEEPVDVVLMGTVSQLQRLATAIDGGFPVGSGGETDANTEGETAARPDGLRVLGDEIREASVAGTGPGSGVGPGDRTTSRQKRTRSIDDSHDVPWESGTAVMGVLNVTPDSFHDGGRYRAASDAVGRAEEMLDAGADILDVGGESTRPGADPVPAEEEQSRVLPVLDRLAHADALVSIDTRKPDVARAAIEAGADILNDVSGLEDPEMARVAADYDVPVVVMHSIETPVDPDRTVEYDDVVETVVGDLAERVLRAERAGVDRSEIIVDPGLGFGKTARENFALLDRLDELRALGCPVLVGHSHKSMFELAGARPGDAFHETIAATALAADRGADIIRVHDVRENVQAVRVARLTGESEYSPDG